MDLAAWMGVRGWRAADPAAKWGLSVSLRELGFRPLAEHGEGHLLCAWTWSSEQPDALVAFGAEGAICVAAHDLDQLLSHEPAAPEEPEDSPSWDDFPTPRADLPDPRAHFEREQARRSRQPGPADHVAANGWFRDLAQRGPKVEIHVHSGLLDGSCSVAWDWIHLPKEGWRGLRDQALLERMLGFQLDDSGALLTNVPRESLADAAGLRTGDVLRSVDGDADICAAWERAGPPQTQLAVTRGRGKLALDLTITVVWQDPHPDPLPVPRPPDPKPMVRCPPDLRLVDEHGVARSELPERVISSFGQLVFVEPLGKVWRAAPAPPGVEDRSASDSTPADSVPAGFLQRLNSWFRGGV